MSLTMAQIIQPLKSARLVILALLANFVLVPLLAYAIILLIPLKRSLKIGWGVNSRRRPPIIECCGTMQI
jgi:BASS family bile acid:Na+ symporter